MADAAFKARLAASMERHGHILHGLASRRVTLDEKLERERQRTGRGYMVRWDPYLMEWHLKLDGLAGYWTAGSQKQAKQHALWKLRTFPTKETT